jgi:hypothetical protein
MASRRIQVEIKKLSEDGYSVTKLSETTLLVKKEANGNHYDFTVTFPEKYPFDAPEISFKGIEQFLGSEYYVTMPIVSILNSIIEKVEDTEYLLLGGYPQDERTRHRSLYNSPSVFIADTANLTSLNLFSSRYYKVDFNSLDELQGLAKQVGQKFTLIVFDWSTYKFFSQDDTFQKRLQVLLSMIKPNGSLVIESPQGSQFSINLSNTRTHQNQIKNQKRNNLDLLQTSLSQLGFVGVQKKLSEITDSFIRQVYEGMDHHDINLMLVKKSTGGKRKTRKLKSKSRRRRR